MWAVKRSLWWRSSRWTSSYDDVFQAMPRLFDQFEIEPDAPGFDVAGAPFGFHLLDIPLADLDADDRLPFLDQGGNFLFESLPVPGEQDTLALSGVVARAHEEIHDGVVADDYRWGAVVIDDVEEV